MWQTIQQWLNPINMPESDIDYGPERRAMVEDQLERRGIRDPHVLDAMLTVPRHVFVPQHTQPAAYADSALPIGHGQTISQPYIVAFMTEAAQISPGDKVLEIGTGSGYGAAVASRIAGEVFTIERHSKLAQQARERFDELGYDNIHVVEGDGSQGWPDEAPYDAIIVTAAAPELPQPLLKQLADGGRLVVPVGTRHSQKLVRAERSGDEIQQTLLTAVRFVPLVGEHGWQRQ